MIDTLIIQQTGNNATVLFLLAAILSASYLALRNRNRETLAFLGYFLMLVSAMFVRVGTWTATGWAGIYCIKGRSGQSDVWWAWLLCDHRHLIMLITSIGIGCALLGIWHYSVDEIPVSWRYSFVILVLSVSYGISVI